jgi:hypothetical protein
VAETAAAHCAPADLEEGFTVDPQYTGDLAATAYSAAADVQAALEYDNYRSGYRTILTRLHPPAGAGSDMFASCVSMRFASAPEAARFFSSYRDLRRQAGSLVTTTAPPAVAGLTDLVAYQEKEQAFHGYGIANTDVVELAGLSGARLFIATVGGPEPAMSRAQALAEAMVRS